MDEEQKKNGAPDEQEEEKPDLTHEMEMLSFGMGALRWGVGLLALFIALTGWYLSRGFGEIFLYAGLGLALIVGASGLFSGVMMRSILKRLTDGKPDKSE